MVYKHDMVDKVLKTEFPSSYFVKNNYIKTFLRATTIFKLYKYYLTGEYK